MWKSGLKERKATLAVKTKKILNGFLLFLLLFFSISNDCYFILFSFSSLLLWLEMVENEKKKTFSKYHDQEGHTPDDRA